MRTCGRKQTPSGVSLLIFEPTVSKISFLATSSLLLRIPLRRKYPGRLTPFAIIIIIFQRDIFNLWQNVKIYDNQPQVRFSPSNFLPPPAHFSMAVSIADKLPKVLGNLSHVLPACLEFPRSRLNCCQLVTVWPHLVRATEERLVNEMIARKWNWWFAFCPDFC